MTVVKDRECERAHRFSAAAAADASSTAVRVPEALPIAEEILDGGEIVLLAIKPSLWFVLFDSVRWVLLGLVLLAVSLSPSLQYAQLAGVTAARLGLVVIAVRLAAALLRWVSRFYVLTNRRLLRVRGVFKINILALELSTISETRLSVGPHEKVTNLGTILIASTSDPDADSHWYTIAKPDEVHAQIRRAIERASGGATR